MTRAQDFRILVSMHLSRLLMRKARRKADTTRRDGHRLAEIVKAVKDDIAKAEIVAP